MVTGIGGGMVRDVLAGRVPIIFRGELYATPALAGAMVAVLMERGGLPVVAAALTGATVCLAWRLLAVWRDWQAPLPTGLGQRLTRCRHRVSRPAPGAGRRW